MALSLPRLLPSEFITSATWNSAMSLLEAEFTLPVTVVWPLQAEGPLDMLGNEIINVTKFWKIYNADEFATFQLVLDAVDTDGAGCIIIPPNTTITTSGAISDVDDLMILGYGPSSVLKHDGGAGTRIMTTTADSRITISNLTIDGDSIPAKDGLVFDNATDVTLDNVRVTNFGGAGDWGIVFNGAVNSNVNIVNCIELDSILLVDCEDVTINNSKVTGKLEVRHPTSGDKALRVTFDNLYFDGVDVEFSNVAASADDNFNIVKFSNCTARASNFTFDKVRQLTLENLFMFGDSDTGKALYLLDCENTSFRSVKVTDYTGDNGIHVEGGTTHEWADVTVANCGNAGGTDPAVRVEGSTTFLSTGLKITDPLWDGLLVDGDFGTVRINDAFVDSPPINRDGIFVNTTLVSTACEVQLYNPMCIGTSGGGQGIATTGGTTLAKRISVIGGVSTGAASFKSRPHNADGLYVGEFDQADATGLRQSQTVYGNQTTWNSGTVALHTSVTKAMTVRGVLNGATEDHVYTVRHEDIAGAKFFTFSAEATSADVVTLTAYNTHGASSKSFTGTVHLVGHPIRGI